MSEIMGVSQFERLFRQAASLDVDKSDLKRMSNFINQKLYDMLIVAQANAKANQRDLIEDYDLPITLGLKNTIREFKQMEVGLALEPILARLAKLPPLSLGYGASVEKKLPEIVGGLVVALAKTFKIIDPEVKNPQTEHWEKAEQIFSLLL